MLLNQFEFVTYEPRGLSRSSLPQGSWTLEDYAADAHQILKYLQWDRCVVLGESFGGMTALHLAADYPSVAEALICTSATAGGALGSSIDLLPLLDLDLQQFSEKMLMQQDRRNRDLQQKDPAQFALKLAQRVDEDRRFLEVSGQSGGYRRLLEARAKHDASGKLGRITCPALILAGSFDDQAPNDAQQRLAKALSNGQYQLQQGGHGFLFNSDQTQLKILDWIESLKLTNE